MEGMTFGCEHEFADVRFGARLPDGCQWSTEDYTIVNSDGMANDPQGKLWPFGGEVNTVPTDRPAGQADVLRDLIEMLGPRVNYRSNLHVHVRVPGLENDLAACKRVLRYIWLNGLFAMEAVDPLARPNALHFTCEEEYEGALKRHRRNLVSHHCMLPAARVREALDATTTDGFLKAHAPGGVHWHLAPRPGINMRSLWQGPGTIEFRCFFGTLDALELRNAVEWCGQFLLAALDGEQPPRASRVLPKRMPYRHSMELRYLETSPRYGRAKARANIARLLEEGAIQKPEGWELP